MLGMNDKIQKSLQNENKKNYDNFKNEFNQTLLITKCTVTVD